MCLHGLLQGVALGLQRFNSRVWTITIAVIAHKLLTLVGVSLQLLLFCDDTLHSYYTRVGMTLFASATPIGLMLRYVDALLTIYRAQ